MKYVANPVEVDAWVITKVCEPCSDGSRPLFLQGENELRSANAGMLARYVPVAGDYWVKQPDGYAYINPKEVFERKYSPAVTGSDGKSYSGSDPKIPG